jgi:hypothetical protein
LIGPRTQHNPPCRRSRSLAVTNRR